MEWNVTWAWARQPVGEFHNVRGESRVEACLNTPAGVPLSFLTLLKPGWTASGSRCANTPGHTLYALNQRKIGSFFLINLLYSTPYYYSHGYFDMEKDCRLKKRRNFSLSTLNLLLWLNKKKIYLKNLKNQPFIFILKEKNVEKEWAVVIYCH